MALLKFISLSVGSLLLLQGAYAQDDSADKSKAQKCLEVMNTARSQVGLSALQAPKTPYLTAEQPTAELLKAVCDQMKANKPLVLAKFDPFKGSTAAYHLSTEDCSTAVEEWKKGFSKISTDSKTLPAAYTVTTDSPKPSDASKPTIQVQQAPYNDPLAVNFAALYNPQTDATAECSVVTCAKTASGTTGLVCMTYPTSLTDDAKPYDDTQWKNILKVFAPSSSSASAAVPTLLALAAAAVGVALM